MQRLPPDEWAGAERALRSMCRAGNDATLRSGEYPVKAYLLGLDAGEIAALKRDGVL